VRLPQVHQGVRRFLDSMTAPATSATTGWKLKQLNEA
jgi:hypothetical protein